MKGLIYNNLILFIISYFTIMNIYREEDIQAITDNLDRILEETIIIRNNVLEPNFDEYKQARTILLDFIKKKKRIIYGGDAYNSLINVKHPLDNIYKSNSRSDIEFYSPEPVLDLIELCNIFYKKKFPYIQGSEANHDETYSLFVNFEQICDTSYMPKNIYGNMPVIPIDGIFYTHPNWILVDIFRQYNDPITSFRRLKDKTFFRANVLLKHYPLHLDNKQSFAIDTKLATYKQAIFDYLITMDTVIFTGSIARNYYLTLDNKLDLNKIEVFSLNFRKDIKTVHLQLIQIMGEQYKEITINM